MANQITLNFGIGDKVYYYVVDKENKKVTISFGIVEQYAVNYQDIQVRLNTIGLVDYKHLYDNVKNILEAVKHEIHKLET